MCKRLSILMSAALLLALAGSAAGVAWTDLDPADHLWSTPGNWTDNMYPLPGQSINIRGIPAGRYYPIIQNGIDGVGGSINIGRDPDAGDPCLTMNGGSLSVGSGPGSDAFLMAYTLGYPGTLNMNAGVIDVNGIMHAGMGDVGTINMAGGRINTLYFKFGNRIDRTGDGRLNLYGGTFYCGGIDIRYRCHADITFGTWIIAGDVRSVINTAIGENKIQAFGGSGIVLVNYDGTNTIITATDGINAYAPSPADDAIDIGLNPILSWTAADGVTGHDVHFGTAPESLTQIASNIADTTCGPGTLEPAQTYYWRVDEITDGSTQTGYVWSFSTITGIALNPSPSNGAEDVATNAVLSWLPAEIATAHKIYLGTDPGALVLKETLAADVNSFDPGGLLMGKAYYWRIDEVVDGGTITGTMWSFITEGFASSPEPFDGAAAFETNVTFSWTPGIQNGSQDFYFGTNFSDVNEASRPVGDVSNDGVVNYADVEIFAEQWLSSPAGTGVSADLNFDNIDNFVDFGLMANSWADTADPEFKVNLPVGSNSYNPGALTAGTTYYWRVDEVQGADRCKGDVWQFTSRVMGMAAFPGAEGWGSDTVGGRGGQLIHVTNLNSSGTGSLNAACQTPGPRIVVFDVSGVIQGTVRITQPYITIAGQTAPGGGITIVGLLSSYDYHVHDVVIRHVRVRPPPEGGASGDGFQLGGSNTYNIVLDHCSVSWAIDETLDFYWAHDITIQWCTIEESDPCGHPEGDHNFGMISAAEDSGAVSAHHNVWAHHYRRVPCMAPYRQNAADDFRNNLIYNCYGGLTHDGHDPGIRSPLNDFYNYTKRGPNTQQETRAIYPFATIAGIDYYIYNNYFEEWGLQGHPAYWTWGGTTPSWVQFNNNGNVLTEPGSTPPITTHPITDVSSATALYDMLLAKAGAWPRDRVTLRTIGEVQIGGADPCTGGSWARNAPAYPDDAWFMDGLTPTAPPTDTDGDGMPDTWETTHGLSPTNPSDRNNIVPAGASPGDRHKDYTYIEYYINEKADSLVP